MTKSKHKIGFLTAVSFVIGNIVGVGIFTTSGYLATLLSSPIEILWAWVAGGVYAFAGAMVYGQLSKIYPFSGGDYIYLTKEVHPAVGYMFGWSALFITYTGSIAALAIGAVYYLSSFLNIPLDQTSLFNWDLGFLIIQLNADKIIAIGIVFVFTLINTTGLKISGRFQIILTASIIAFMIIFIFSAFFSEKLATPANNPMTPVQFQLNSFFVALVAVLFTYTGWTAVVYIAEEIENAQKIIIRVLVASVSFIIVLYVLINMVYLYSVPIENMKHTVNIAAESVRQIWGNPAAVSVSGFIFIAILSTINSTVLSGSRIYFAMSRRGYLFGKLSTVNSKGIPAKSLYLQAAWSFVLILSGSFNQLLTYVVFVIVIFSALAGFVNFKIQFQIKKRIFSLNSLISMFYVLFCLLIAGNTLISKPYESLFGILIISISVLVYRYEKIRIE